MSKSTRDNTQAKKNFNNYLKSLKIFDDKMVIKLSQTCCNMKCPTYNNYKKHNNLESMSFDNLIDFIESRFFYEKNYITTTLAHLSPHQFGKNLNHIDHWLNTLPLCPYCHDYFDNWNGGAGSNTKRARTNEDEMTGYALCKNIHEQKMNFHLHFDVNFNLSKEIHTDNAFVDVHGKHEAQINPDFYFRNFPNDNFQSCINEYDKKLQSAIMMKKFVGDDILTYKPVNKIKNSNEKKLKTCNKHAYLLIDSKALNGKGNPSEMYKDYGEDGILHGYKSADGTKSKWTDTSISIFANTNTQSNCGFCGMIPRHVETRLKTSAAKMFDEIWAHYMKTNNVSYEEAKKNNKYIELGKLVQYDNIVPTCPNCRSSYDKVLTLIENGNAYQDKLHRTIEARKQIGTFNKIFTKNFQNYNEYVDEVILEEHRYKPNPTARGLSEKIEYKKYVDNPYWDMEEEVKVA